jgi:hypothetical protein
MTEDLANLERELIDSGKLIEAGWIGLRIAAIPPTAPPVQLDEMRMAFFAGAQHLFGSIMKALDPDDEVTEDDMRRLDLINAELNLFLVDFMKKHGI